MGAKLNKRLAAMSLTAEQKALVKQLAAEIGALPSLVAKTIIIALREASEANLPADALVRLVEDAERDARSWLDAADRLARRG